jgi:DNA invertase Pin-like site-specific DNA recombinase
MVGLGKTTLYRKLREYKHRRQALEFPANFVTTNSRRISLTGIQFHQLPRKYEHQQSCGAGAIVAAVAPLERDLIRERVTAGIRNAQANGKRLGRPRREVDRE